MSASAVGVALDIVFAILLTLYLLYKVLWSALVAIIPRPLRADLRRTFRR